MTRIRHMGIVVSDMTISLAFYHDLIGLQNAAVVEESSNFIDGLLGMTEAAVSTAKLGDNNGGPMLELLCFTSPGPSDPTPLNAIGPTHVALTVTDLDGMYDRIIAAGYAFNAPPTISPDGGVKVAFCQDPDGTYVELVEVLTTSQPAFPAT